jgi:hypothetical protein
MVKVPIGTIVQVDLWDPKKKRGMIKYFTNTMNLIRAESEFSLIKNDMAIVIQSLEGFCLIIPKDENYDLLEGTKLQNINLKRLIIRMYEILKEYFDENGGILSIENFFYYFKKTTVKDFISKKLISKAMRNKEAPFDYIKDDDMEYAILRMADCANDERVIFSLARLHPYLTINFIQREIKWSILRIKRALNYLLQNDRCRKESSYLTGDRYFFPNI